MLSLALGLMLGSDPLPSPEAAADALLVAMMCKDEDGFTLCDLRMAVAIEFTRFECIAEPVRFAGESARATCTVAGRVRYAGGRPGTDVWVPLAATKADFWLPVPRGSYDAPRWQAF